MAKKVKRVMRDKRLTVLVTASMMEDLKALAGDSDSLSRTAYGALRAGIITLRDGKITEGKP